MSQSSQTIVADLAAPSIQKRLLSRRSLRDSTLLLVLAAIWLFFYFATNGTFLTQRNLILLALQTAIVGLAAISAVNASEISTPAKINLGVWVLFSICGPWVWFNWGLSPN